MIAFFVYLAILACAGARREGARVRHSEPNWWALGWKEKFEHALRSVFSVDAEKDFRANKVLADPTASEEEKLLEAQKKLSRSIWNTVQRRNAQNAKEAACDHERVNDPCTTVRYDERKAECVVRTVVTSDCSKQRAQQGIRFI